MMSANQPSPKFRLPLVALAAGLSTVLLALAGCGSSSDPSSNGSSQASPASKDNAAEVIDGRVTQSAFNPSEIYKREAQGVVTVISVVSGSAVSGEGQRGLGSGFLISSDGEIATNAHVVTTGTGASLKAADEVYVQFGDRDTVSAKIIGYDPNSDFALLKVDPDGLDIVPLPLGSSADLIVGAPVAAIGSPFGQPQSLSVGVISGIDRAIESLTSFKIIGGIQTDAAINHGNSGGPLVNAKGEVLGINSQIRTSGGGGEGVGFAVPIDTIKRSLAQLRAAGKTSYPYLGVTTVALFPELAKRFGLGVAEGAWVQTVSRAGPAAAAGIRAGSKQERFQSQPYEAGGDVIVEVAGVPIRAESDLARSIETHKAGETITIVIYRDGGRREVKVKLGERPLGSLNPAAATP